jgi:hypothetical protein
VRRWLRAAVALIVLASLSSGGLLALSGRGILGHLPGAEVVIDQCTLPGGARVRLDEGNLGATTPFWYLATLQESFFASERRFLQIYGQPLLSSVRCSGEYVDLLDLGGEVELSVSLERIDQELLDEPLGLHYGEPADADPSGPVPRLLGLLCGTPLLLLGGVGTRAALRQLQAHPGEQLGG